MQYLWHAIEPEFLRKVRRWSPDRRRGVGSTSVSVASVLAPCTWLTNAPLSSSPYPRPSRAPVLHDPAWPSIRALVIDSRSMAMGPDYGSSLGVLCVCCGLQAGRVAI